MHQVRSASSTASRRPLTAQAEPQAPESHCLSGAETVRALPSWRPPLIPRASVEASTDTVEASGGAWVTGVAVPAARRAETVSRQAVLGPSGGGGTKTVRGRYNYNHNGDNY